MAAGEVAESAPAAETPQVTAPKPETPAPASEQVDLFAEKTATAVKEEKPAPSEAEPKGESVPSPEEAKPTQTESKPESSKAEKRIKQLTAQIKTLERQVAQNQYQQPKPLMKQPAARPDLETWTGTIEEYRAALDKSVEEERAFAIQQDRIERQRAEAEEKRRTTEAEALAVFQKRSQRIVKANGEFDVPKMLQIVQPNPTTDGFFVDSEVGPEILHFLSENPDEAERIRDLTPYQTIREMVRLENRFLDEIKGIKPKEVPKPPKKVEGRASAPAPPKTAADLIFG